MIQAKPAIGRRNTQKQKRSRIEQWQRQVRNTLALAHWARATAREDYQVTPTLPRTWCCPTGTKHNTRRIEVRTVNGCSRNSATIQNSTKRKSREDAFFDRSLGPVYRRGDLEGLKGYRSGGW